MHLTLVIASLQAGGAERVLSHLANHWASQGHDVSLVTFDAPETPPFYRLDSNIRLIQLNQHKLSLHPLSRLRNIFKRLYVLRRVFKTLNPDVILSFITTMNILTLMAATRLKIPVVISERIDPHHHVISKFYERLRFILYPRCHKLIVQTQSAANYFSNERHIRLEIIPNFVFSPQNTKTTYAAQVTKILSIGRLDFQKDHRTLIQAFAALLPRYPHLTLTIYGEGPDRTALEQLIASLNLQKKGDAARVDNKCR